MFLIIHDLDMKKTPTLSPFLSPQIFSVRKLNDYRIGKDCPLTLPARDEIFRSFLHLQILNQSIHKSQIWSKNINNQHNVICFSAITGGMLKRIVEQNPHLITWLVTWSKLYVKGKEDNKMYLQVESSGSSGQSGERYWRSTMFLNIFSNPGNEVEKV